MKYFRDKYIPTKVTRDTLVKKLAEAKATRNEAKIALAQYNLDLLDNDFNGDIELYKRNAGIQNMRLITLEETVDKFANGRFRIINMAGGKSRGTVLRSTVEGVYGSIKAKDPVAVSFALRELLGRLPETTKHPEIVQGVLDRLRQGVKERFPNENKRPLGAALTNGMNILSSQGLDAGAVESAPHMSWDGRVLQKRMLVQYENNEGDISVGVVDSLAPVDKNDDNPNQYNDYVLVRFKDQSGKIGSPVKISSKNLKVLDDTGMSQESRDRMTVYTPNLKGDERILARFGEAFLLQQRAKDGFKIPGQSDTISDGYRPAFAAAPEMYNTDNAAPGGYLYDKDGLPIGQIAAVRDAKSESGEDGYSIAYVEPDGSLGFIGVKAGEIRAPKVGLVSSDGRGSKDSDPGFTPNPADFSDIGLDAPSIGNTFSDPEEPLFSIIELAPLVAKPEVAAGLVSQLIKLNQARAAAIETPDSDELRAKYKEELQNAYSLFSDMSFVGGSFTGQGSKPLVVPSDDLLDPADITAINAKLQATKKRQEATATEKKPAATYDEVVAARSTPEATYDGYMPQGFQAEPVAESMAFETAQHTKIFKQIVEMFGGDVTTGISDKLAAALASSATRSQYVGLDGQINIGPMRHMTNEFGDRISVSKNSDGSYSANDEDLETTGQVFANLRSKLNLGDKPLSAALIDDSSAGRALGFVWTSAMWSSTSPRQAVAHLVTSRIPKPGERAPFFKDDEKFVPGRSWWSVDLKSEPERLAEYIMSHELGHVMQGEAMRQFGQNLSQTTWNKFYGPVARSHRVSQYGQTNYNEHFAESFAKFMLTGEAHPEFKKFLADTGLLKAE